MAGLGDVPFQDARVPHILDGLRHVTKDGDVFHATVDAAQAQLRILAEFFGGQAHRQHILRRILEE